MDETKKYIIEFSEDPHTIRLLKLKNGDKYPVTEFKTVTPYTEPDLEQVRKEAYQQGYKDGYNKHDTERIRKRGYDKGLDDIGNALRLLLFQYSNYTLQEIFGYDTARAVVEHFEGSEIVARIRCYEGGVKQDTETIRKEAYEQGYTDGRKKHEVEVHAIAYTNGKQDGYQKGLNDAWEAARKIANIPYGEEEKVIGSDGWTFIINHTASEAIEKIRQYEQEKDRQARIEYNFDEVKDVIETTAKKYNMSLDEIAEVLKKMGEH